MRVVLALCLLALLPTGADAGDRDLELMLINMTPNGAGEAAQACSARIRRTLRRGDNFGGVVMNAMGETAFRESIGNPEGAFMTWSGTIFEPARDRGQRRTWIDAFVLFDCRPDDQQLDVLVVPTRGEDAERMQLRDVPIDEAAQDWVANRALQTGWVGFSP